MVLELIRPTIEPPLNFEMENTIWNDRFYLGVPHFYLVLSLFPFWSSQKMVLKGVVKRLGDPFEFYLTLTFKLRNAFFTDFILISGFLTHNSMKKIKEKKNHFWYFHYPWDI